MSEACLDSADDFSIAVRRSYRVVPKTAENSATISKACKRDFRGRGWVAPADVIAATIPPGVEVVSSDGVRSFVTQLAKPALVNR
jgi:hypothetical protein